jgi:hypothetical protein
MYRYESAKAEDLHFLHRISLQKLNILTATNPKPPAVVQTTSKYSEVKMVNSNKISCLGPYIKYIITLCVFGLIGRMAGDCRLHQPSY